MQKDTSEQICRQRGHIWINWDSLCLYCCPKFHRNCLNIKDSWLEGNTCPPVLCSISRGISWLVLATVAVPRNICHRRETTLWWTFSTTSNASTPQPVQCGRWGCLPQKVPRPVCRAKKTNRSSLPTSIWSADTTSQVWEEIDTQFLRSKRKFSEESTFGHRCIYTPS